MELLCKLKGIESSETLKLLPKQEPVRLTSMAKLGFPIRDLVSLAQTEKGLFQLQLSFLGLQGSQYLLPGYDLDSLATEYLHKETKLVDFMDLFNYRLSLLLHQIWREYRYYINYRTNGTDEFSNRMFALVGLGHKSTRNKLSVNHSKMLAYAGILSSPARSPEIICNLVSHCFDLEHVNLKGWRFCYINLGIVMDYLKIEAIMIGKKT